MENKKERGIRITVSDNGFEVSKKLLMRTKPNILFHHSTYYITILV